MSVRSHAQPPSSSKKVARGICAGVAGIAMLAAGGGSFAAWSDNAIADAAIGSGELKLSTGAVEPVWTFNGAAVGNGDLSGIKVVPGDKLTFTDQVTLIAEGDNLAAELRTQLGNVRAEGQLTDAFTYDFRVNGEPVTNNESLRVITDPSGRIEENYSISVTVVFDDVDGLTAQGQDITFEGTGLVVSQTLAQSGTSAS